MTIKSHQVLLIEDDVALGESTMELLIEQGHEVAWATSADDAFKEISRRSFDAAIMDLGLGLDNGVTLVSALKRQGRAIPPLIIFSAQPIETIRDAVKKTGARVALQKPCTGIMIAEAIEFVISINGSGAAV